MYNIGNGRTKDIPLTTNRDFEKSSKRCLAFHYVFQILNRNPIPVDFLCAHNYNALPSTWQARRFL